MSGLFLIFLALVAMVLYFGFWTTIGGIFLALLWIAVVVVLIIAFIFAMVYIIEALS